MQHTFGRSSYLASPDATKFSPDPKSHSITLNTDHFPMKRSTNGTPSGKGGSQISGSTFHTDREVTYLNLKTKTQMTSVVPEVFRLLKATCQTEKQGLSPGISPCSIGNRSRIRVRTHGTGFQKEKIASRNAPWNCFSAGLFPYNVFPLENHRSAKSWFC